jgi:phosphoenolpyruvate carboxykinase (ATP)
MKIGHTRALLNAALNGSLEKMTMKTDPVFGFQVPTEAPNVPAEILDPRNTWSDPQGYEAQAKKLTVLFHENFEQFKEGTPERVLAAGPVK